MTRPFRLLPGWPALAWLALLAVVPATAAKAPAPRIRVVPVAGYDAMPLTLDPGGAWSPRGTLLALRRDLHQIWVLDASRPGRRPQKVYDTGQWIRSYGWSPDGGWLLLVVGDPGPTNERMLVAASLAGAVDTLRREDLLAAFWGSDGSIHYQVGNEWRQSLPPAGWKPPAAFVPRPVPVIGGEHLALTLGTGAPGARPPLHVGTFMDDTRRVIVMDALPDGSRQLVSISEDTSAALRVVDDRGRTVTDLRRAGFWPTSIDGDSRMIVGHAGEGGGGEQGPTRTWLVAADRDGRWTTRIAGSEGGTDPQMSREGSFIAFAVGKGTRVAQLVVETPAAHP